MKTVLVKGLHGNNRDSTVVGYQVKGCEADKQKPNHPVPREKEREGGGKGGGVKSLYIVCRCANVHTLSTRRLLELRLVQLTEQQDSPMSPV